MADDKKIEKAEDKKDEKKKTEDLTPTPTQAEADEWKVKLAGPDAKVDKREVGEVPEIITPTPTQWENDAAKIVAMGGDPPTDPGAPIDQAREKRAIEGGKSGDYQTRASRPKE